MYLTSVIDVALWDKAGWYGTVFGYDARQECPLFMGPLFTHEQPGREIFERWRKYLGAADAHELIQVSIIEGDIKGQEPGYSVFIGTNPRAAIDLAEIRDKDTPTSHIMLTGRFCRMNPPADSPNLANFKKGHGEQGRYLLVPVFKRDAGVEPEFALAIKKTKVSLLLADDLDENAVESAVLRKPESELPAVPQTQDRENGAFEDKRSVTVALAVLEAELAAGTVKRPVDPLIADSLASVRYDADGQAQLDTVNPMLSVLARVVLGDVAERQALNVPLRDLQTEFVEFLEEHFEEPYQDMIKHGLTPHAMADVVSRNEHMVKQISAMAPEMFDALAGFWKRSGIVVVAHLKSQKTLRAVYGGNVFPHPQSDLLSNVGMYADTLVLPDPLLNSLSMQEAVVPDLLAKILVRNALTAMSYRELALADVDTPIVVFAPTQFFLSDRLRELVVSMSEEDVRLHLQEVFGRQFSDTAALNEYIDAFADERALAAAVADPNRFLFDLEFNPLPMDQIARLLEDADKVRTPPEHADARRRILSSFQGRFIQTNDALTHADMYGGVPLIDAPTAWQYFLWKLEYAAQRPKGVRDQRDLIVQHVMHTHLGDVPALRNISADTVIEIRRRGLLPSLRNVIREGVGEIAQADEDSVNKVAERVCKNLRAEIAKYQGQVATLAKEKQKLVGEAALVTGGLAISIAAAACGAVPLGIAAAITGTAGLPSAKGLYDKVGDLLAKHRKLKQNPVGMFCRTRK